jgi:hypothetical protein
MESPCNIIGFFSVISSNRYTFFILEKKKEKKSKIYTTNYLVNKPSRSATWGTCIKFAIVNPTNNKKPRRCLQNVIETQKTIKKKSDY